MFRKLNFNLNLSSKKERKGFTQTQVNEIEEKQKGKCAICKTKLYRSSTDKDHKDGDRSNNKTSNLQLICKNCHGKKTNKDRLKKQTKKKVDNPFNFSLNENKKINLFGKNKKSFKSNNKGFKL